MSNFTQNGKLLRAVRKGLYRKPEYLSSLVSDAEIKRTNRLSLFKKFNLRKGLSFSGALAFSVLFFFSSFQAEPNHPKALERYSIYTAKPLVLESISTTIATKDARAQKIDEIFAKYNCPLTGYGEDFVTDADEYGIPWWI